MQLVKTRSGRKSPHNLHLKVYRQDPQICPDRTAKDNMKALRIITITVFFLTLSLPAVAETQDYKSVKATKIAVATAAANGQRLSYLCSEHPEVTALIVEIPPGGETGWHLHDVPVYAYMLEGAIDVEMADGKSYHFKKGEAIFEVLATLHNGRNSGRKSAKMIVFYTGEEGKPNVTRAEKPANR
jgi:quercetin dioxygenase-like cupin family protein